MASIKNPLYEESEHVSLRGVEGLGSLDRIDYPLFCFRHLHRDFDIDKCLCADKTFSRQFLKKIGLVSKLSWIDIQMSDRRGHGTEKIFKSSITKSIPSSITDDVNDFLSFYFNGDRGRIIGFRNQMVFHVVFIDTELTVYRH